MIVAVAASAAEWRQWRGPERDGKSTETGLLKKWPDGGPPLVWKATGIGEGFSSFSAGGGRLYTQGQRDRRQYVIALDQATGRKIWETPNGSSYSNRRGSGPRGTPTLDGNTVFALASNGRLIALDAGSGKQRWAVDLLAELGGRNTNWGMSESPLVDGERIIITPGGDAGIAALDKSSGEVIWTSDADRAAYSSVMIVEAGGVKQYVTLTGSAGVGVRAADGKVLWRYEKVSNRTANVATPVVRDDKVFLSSDYGTGCALLQLQPSGAAEEIYFSRDMRNHYSTSVLVGDHLYGFSSRVFTAMKFDTGEVAWKDRSVGKGQVIYADGMLYLLSEDGVAGLVEPSPDAYNEISRFEIDPGEYPTWTLPVIADGRLLLREQDTIYCFDIRSK